MALSYDWASGRVLFDDPHADGLIDTLPLGRNWPAHEPRLDPSSRYTADLSGSYGWILGHQLEYLPELHAIAPRGQSEISAMDISDWTILSGAWRESPTVGVLKTTWLSFYDGRPGLLSSGDYGRIKSDVDYDPVQQWWFLLSPVAEDETDPVILDIRWFGDGEHPEYLLRIPQPGASAEGVLGMYGVLEYPALYGKPQAAASWALIDTYRRSSGINQKTRIGADLMGIRMEQDAGWWQVEFAGLGERWAFKGEWHGTDGSIHEGVEITTGPVGMATIGRRACINLQELEYPSDVVALPSTYLVASDQYNSTPTYWMLRDEPTGTDAAIEADVLSPTAKRPKVTFTSTDPHRRAVVYNVAEIRPCEFTETTTTPRSTVGEATTRLLRSSGDQDESLRGSHANLEIIPQLGQSLPDLGLNDKATIEVTLDNGSTYETMHVGYLAPPELTPSGTEPTRIEVAVPDAIEARLSEHQFTFSPSWAGWPIDEAFEAMLGYGGVPSSLIEVDAALVPGWEGGYFLPVNDPKGDLGLQPHPGTEIPRAIDQVMETRDVLWGWDPTLGKYVLKPRPTHTSGDYDWILREEALTEDGIVFDFRNVEDRHDFINYLFVMVGRGWKASSKLLLDLESITDPTADDFVADLVQEVLMNPDADSVEDYADELWELRNAFNGVIYWSLQTEPTLKPGQFVQVKYSDVRIPTDSIYRIRQKHWELDSEKGRLEQDFEAILVEEGTS